MIEEIVVDVTKLRAAVLRVERTHGRGATPREIQLLAAAVRKAMPELMLPGEGDVPTITTQPCCISCGTAVEKRGQQCPACRAKSDARPKPLFDLGPKPQPAYAPKHEERGDDE
ncbi:MAG TPA: hypothetical protein VGE98_11195 [Thermoanaerobaculia bacterium]